MPASTPASAQQDIALKIIVQTSDGHPYEGAVTVECQHQTLSDRRVVRSVDASRPIAITGLKRTPQGLYQITVTPIDVFTPSGQFVNIPASGFATLTFVFDREPAATRFELLDDAGNIQSEFPAGDGLLFRAAGFPAGRSQTIRVREDNGEELFSVSVVADRYGVVDTTTIWPDIGIGVPDRGGRYSFATIEEAQNAMAGRNFQLQIGEGQNAPNVRFSIARQATRTRVDPVASHGALQRGFIVGSDAVRIRGRQFAPGGLVDLYLVPAQRNWNEGDAIRPVRNADGSEVAIRARADESGLIDAELWARESARVGSYDIIARPVLAGEYLADERVLRRSDILSDRFNTTLVLRDEIFHYKPVHLGCVAAMKDIAGKTLSGPPYFEFTNNFPRGTDVWAALDPAGLMPAAIGKKVRFSVTAHKDAAGWAASDDATDINGNIAEMITSSGCINANKTLVWANPQTAGKYDIVVDFGNNDPNPASFVADGTFDPPLDFIDGYFNVGFYVTDDPSVAGAYQVGQTSYNDPAVTIPAAGVWAPPPYGVLGETMSGTLSLPLQAEVRYPADSNGVNVPFSATKTNYPVFVIMHGMHTTADPSYLGYNFLLNHLASHGYVAVSIDCNAVNAIGGMQDTRAQAILAHLTRLQAKNATAGLFQNKLDMTRIAIMGHSRGGDGVVQAEVLNQSLPTPWPIKAVIALAPTDFSGITSAALTMTTSKFLCIYGSNDADVAGWWGFPPGATGSDNYAGTGFRFYDRATTEKAMVFVFGATHNRFNTEWGTESGVDTASPKIISAGQHQTLLKGYVTAFLQAHFDGRAEQLDYFNGELKIPAASSVDVFSQYRQASASRTMDDFETQPGLNTSSLSGAVTFANLDGVPSEGGLGSMDTNTPHQTRGLRLKWNNTTATYRSEIPLSGALRDVSGFKFLSFRVTQKTGSAANPANQNQDFLVRLNSTGGGPSRAVRAGYFQKIPFPYRPEYTGGGTEETENTKSALTTVRIPLEAWTIKCLSAPIVNLTDVESLAFEFQTIPTGEVEIDDLEFTP